MGRLFALDVGTKTIGLAVTDPSQQLVHPVSTLARKGVKQDIVQLQRILAEWKPEALVVGLPYELDDSEARSARLARQVGDALGEASGLPVHYVDERYTSVESEALLIAMDVSRARRKQVIDQVAAMRILERFLRDRPPA